MIFEPRYRVLFNTLLDGEKGVEEGLVQKDSPWRGSRRFGMCFLDESGRLASLGTVLEVETHAHVEDGRIYVMNRGCQRFRITSVVKAAPLLVAEVELLEEDDDDGEQARELSRDVSGLLRDTLRLHLKATQKGEGSVQEPRELSSLNPCQLSYWVASVFSDSRDTQQMLLEEGSTVKRLKKEKEILEGTLKFYSAATALQSVFDKDSGTGDVPSGTPPPGGPD